MLSVGGCWGLLVATCCHCNGATVKTIRVKVLGSPCNSHPKKATAVISAARVVKYTPHPHCCGQVVNEGMYVCVCVDGGRTKIEVHARTDKSNPCHLQSNIRQVRLPKQARKHGPANSM